MFTVVGDTIYYDGREFATITVTGAKNGGWVYDAISHLDEAGSMTVDEFAEFYKEYKSGVNNVIDEVLTKAVNELWLNAGLVDPIGKQLEQSLNTMFEDTAENELGVHLDGR